MGGVRQSEHYELARQPVAVRDESQICTHKGDVPGPLPASDGHGRCNKTRKTDKIPDASIPVFPECFLCLQVSDLICEILLLILRREPKENIPVSWLSTSPLVLGLSVFLVTRTCGIHLGVKGWAQLCLLVSSEAVERTNLDEAFRLFPNIQQ